MNWSWIFSHVLLFVLAGHWSSPALHHSQTMKLSEHPGRVLLFYVTELKWLAEQFVRGLQLGVFPLLSQSRVEFSSSFLVAGSTQCSKI